MRHRRGHAARERLHERQSGGNAVAIVIGYWLALHDSVPPGMLAALTAGAAPKAQPKCQRRSDRKGNQEMDRASGRSTRPNSNLAGVNWCEEAGSSEPIR